MNLTIANYTIQREDKFNVTLSVTRPKQQSPLHKKVEGNKTEVIGYYSTLEGALKSLLNRYVLDEGDLRDAQSILEAISRAESMIDEACERVESEQPRREVATVGPTGTEVMS